MYKTNVVLHILKIIEKEWHARSGDERPYCLKSVGKINTLSTRYGRSLAPTWAAPFLLGVRTLGAPMGLQKLQKQIQIDSLGCYGGTLWGRPIWTMRTTNTFPCSMPLISLFQEAFPCSMAVVLYSCILSVWIRCSGSALSGRCHSGGRGLSGFLIFSRFWVCARYAPTYFWEPLKTPGKLQDHDDHS